MVMNAVEDAVEYTTSIQETLGDDYNYVVLLAEETKRVAAQIVRFGKSQQVDAELTVNVGGEDIPIYGSRTFTATSSTTLARLAALIYGDPSKALLIAVFNGITDEDILPGATIRLPLVVRSVQADDNKIFSWYRTSDYGIDIALRETGHSGGLLFNESGDFATKNGDANLIQAINLRLNEYLGNRLRLTVYGLAVSIGAARSDGAPIAYIVSNLRDTLRQDPRIKGIENIKLRGSGDKLYTAFDVLAINDTVKYEGVI
jgi:hypothetical protein